MPAEQIEVVVASLEEAEAQIAEFWVGGVLFGHTLLSEGELELFVEPRPDGQRWELDFHDVRRSLNRATELLRLQREPKLPAGTPPRH
jgi:hypothetical protein